MQKKCNRCGEIKFLIEFSKHCGTPDGYQRECKVCNHELCKAYRLKIKDREMSKKTCETCGERFLPTHHHKVDCIECEKFHNDLEAADKERDKYVKAVCKCGEEFSTKLTHDRLQQYKFCQSCRDKFSNKY